VLRDLDFRDRARQGLFVLDGRSGCGKSTVLRALIGLLEPVKGRSARLVRLCPGLAESAKASWRRIACSIRARAVELSMTLGRELGRRSASTTRLEARRDPRGRGAEKLALSGPCGGFEDILSRGIKRRSCRSRAGAGARDRAPDPDVLFLGRASAGLDPVDLSAWLDDLILELATASALRSGVTRSWRASSRSPTTACPPMRRRRTGICQGSPPKSYSSK